MAKVKYYYDPETLSYRPISSGKRLKISNFFSIFFKIISCFYFSNIKTPKEILKERELNNFQNKFKLNQIADNAIESANSDELKEFIEYILNLALFLKIRERLVLVV